VTENPVSGADRLLELIVVVVLGITTVGTAWCGFQATRWNARSGELNGVAAQQYIEGARVFGLATQRVGYDSNVVSRYAEISQEGNDALLKFYRQSVVRPDFLPVLDRWQAEQKAGKSGVGVFEDKAYLAGQFADYQKTLVAAQQATSDSKEAGQVADGYVRTTILLAVALFFAGVTSSFRYRLARLILLAAATATVALAAARIVGLPIA
jgi:hypothetical protein